MKFWSVPIFLVVTACTYDYQWTILQNNEPRKKSFRVKAGILKKPGSWFLLQLWCCCNTNFKQYFSRDFNSLWPHLTEQSDDCRTVSRPDTSPADTSPRTNPRLTLPRRALPRRTFPRTDNSLTGHLPEGHFPDWTFPRTDVFLNFCIF